MCTAFKQHDPQGDLVVLDAATELFDSTAVFSNHVGIYNVFCPGSVPWLLVTYSAATAVVRT